ncbi:FAD-linked oxidase C-terminal domain-containing protein [Bradyrhizobium sp.]|uniref:FAD-linked oxidase C-terminal domain-containing protein n=1 Tax=Bradyrhizobium sp. TaxID=376 RepID=UPI0026264EF6|nr:FAD-linked oxidase C-terminal domain-containing protein [Bradyrhizobium sp.]
MAACERLQRGRLTDRMFFATVGVAGGNLMNLPMNTGAVRANRNIRRTKFSRKPLAMRALKQALDPQSIFNPGKILRPA